MTTIRISGQQAGAAAADGCVYLSGMAGRYLTALGGQRLGRLSDVIVRLRGTQYPLVTGKPRRPQTGSCVVMMVVTS